MSDKLKPCPFCGGDARIEKETRGGLAYFVTCNVCMGDGAWGEYKGEAIQTWNTRPIEDALRAENERYKKALEKIKTIPTWANASADAIHDIARAALKKSD